MKTLLRLSPALFAAAFCLLFAARGASAEPNLPRPSLSKDGDRAFEKLANTDVFADTAIGVAGSLSENVAAFRVVLGEIQANKAFTWLVAHGTRAGKLYGLAGLYHTDQRALARATRQVLTRHGKSRVKVHFGCMKGEWSIAELIDAGDKGIRVDSGKTFIDSLTEHPGGEMDIVGGGYPLSFTGKAVHAP